MTDRVEITFFSRTYDEAYSLLVESRNYLQQLKADPRSIDKTLSLSERVRFSCETMRHTTRLTQIMAWLLAQRAFQAGEITREEALGESYKLSAQDVCLESVKDEQFPAALEKLLERSLNLYQRVQRLDDDFRNSEIEEYVRGLDRPQGGLRLISNDSMSEMA